MTVIRLVPPDGAQGWKFVENRREITQDGAEGRRRRRNRRATSMQRPKQPGQVPDPPQDRRNTCGRGARWSPDGRFIAGLSGSTSNSDPHETGDHADSTVLLPAPASSCPAEMAGIPLLFTAAVVVRLRDRKHRSCARKPSDCCGLLFSLSPQMILPSRRAIWNKRDFTLEAQSPRSVLALKLRNPAMQTGRAEGMFLDRWSAGRESCR